VGCAQFVIFQRDAPIRNEWLQLAEIGRIVKSGPGTDLTVPNKSFGTKDHENRWDALNLLFFSGMRQLEMNGYNWLK
jgi:hypothetical protein